MNPVIQLINTNKKRKKYYLLGPVTVYIAIIQEVEIEGT
jgi:hypothetical protein